MAELSDMLTFLRRRMGLTQQELADKINMSRSAIGMYEAGKREPDLETLEVFADFYNVDMNTLTGHSKPPKIEKRWCKLHNNFEKLNEAGQNHLVEYSDFLTSKGEYKKDPEQKPTETKRVWLAARSTDNAPSGWVDMPTEEVEKIFNAPDADVDF